jgi:hypothetical protein
MKIKLIACEALYREFCMATAQSPHVFDVEFVSFGLHDTPSELRAELQRKIDACEGQGYDRIVLGYGLCSRGTAELAARSIPIIMPRAHDCITLFLGSRAAYSEEFNCHPGTYYYTSGWIERKAGEVQQGFIDEVYAQRTKDRYQEYVEKYGEDNAKFLIEQESQWMANYSRAALIDMGLGDVEEYRRFTCQLAQDNSWEFAEVPGDMSLVRRLANGEWDSEDFLTVKPGQSITESFDELVLKAE